MSILIAFHGLARSGKGVATRRLISKHGFTVHKLAGPLKNMLRSLGLTEEHIEGSLKEKPCDLLGGQTPRYAMQTLGMEWGRDLIHKSLWHISWVNSKPDSDLVVDDLRFPNDYDFLKSLGATVVKVERPGVERGSHASENQQLPHDHLLLNDGALEDLQIKVDALLSELRRA